MLRSLYVLFLLLTVPMLSGCAPQMANRGNLVEEDKLEQIKIGESSRTDVVTLLGTPTQLGLFDENKWYYIGRQTQQYSFFDPELVEQKIVVLTFDEDGKVQTIAKLSPDQIHKDIEPVEEVTPTYGHEGTFLSDFFGNLGRSATPGQQKGK